MFVANERYDMGWDTQTQIVNRRGWLQSAGMLVGTDDGKVQATPAGLGVGETMAYHLAHPDEAPRVADCTAPLVLRHKLIALRDRLAAELGRLDAPPVDDCLSAYAGFAARVSIVDSTMVAQLLRAGDVVFEGAQGVLLGWNQAHPATSTGRTP